MKTFELIHIGEDYCKVLSNDNEEFEFPLAVAELFLGELRINEKDIDIKELEKFFKED